MCLFYMMLNPEKRIHKHISFSKHYKISVQNQMYVTIIKIRGIWLLNSESMPWNLCFKILFWNWYHSMFNAPNNKGKSLSMLANREPAIYSVKLPKKFKTNCRKKVFLSRFKIYRVRWKFSIVHIRCSALNIDICFCQ